MPSGRRSSIQLEELVWKHYKQCFNQSEVARILQLARSTVGNIIRRMQDRRYESKKSKPGRIPLLLKPHKKTISRILAKNPFATCKSIKDQLNISCSLETIRQVIKKKGFISKKMKKKPFLSPTIENKRLEFSSSNLRNQDWSDIFFWMRKSLTWMVQMATASIGII